MSGDVLIRKQKIRITTSSEKLAFECRQFDYQSLTADLNKTYENLFYQSTQSDQYLIIDSLKVDLGVISTHDFKHHFFDLLEEKLITELKHQFETVADPTNFKEASRKKAETTRQPDSIIYATQNEQNNQALFVFLQSGIFPWWYQKKNGKTPAELLSDFSSDERTNFLVSLIAKARSLPTEVVKQIIKRLLIQLKEAAYQNYLTELSKLFSETFLQSNVQTLIDQKLNLTNLFAISLRDFYEQAVVCVLFKNDHSDFLKSFLMQLQQSFSITTDQLHERVKEHPIPNLSMESLFYPNKKIDEDKMISSSSFSIHKSTKPIEPDEVLYVSNAGLVILHPFLSSFFKGLDLLDDENQFTSAETQIKAAVLLYYLQCGLEEYKEWEMPLNKILCGMATDELIPDDIIISEHEKNECNSLLQSVIEYWTALKGASIEALQTTFITREGKIVFKENHWLIQVERTGVDILLDRLPWGIGTIKLPWLKALIYIEW